MHMGPHPKVSRSQRAPPHLLQWYPFQRTTTKSSRSITKMMTQVAGLSAYELTRFRTFGPRPNRVLPFSLLNYLSDKSRPLYPRTEPHVVWNGESSAEFTLIDNPSTEPAFQLVRPSYSVTIGTGLANLTNTTGTTELDLVAVR